MAKDTKGTLSGDAMGGAGKMGIGIIGRVGIQGLSIVVLARLLMPEDYGLVAMVMAVVAIAAVLRDFGLTFASVQSKEMSPELRSNLFWVNAAAGVITFLLAFAASWPISWLYGDPRLVTLTWAIAPVYLLNAFAGQYQADLNRRMRFGKIVIAEVGSAAIGLALAIVAALAGAGYWSLAIQQVSTALFMLALVVYFAKWLPRRYDRSVSIRKQVTLGFDIFLSQILNYASKNADTVILGVRLDATSVGFYDRGYQIYSTVVGQINQPSTRVALPVLSKLQDDPGEFKRFITRGQLTLMLPLMFIMSVGVGFGSVLIPAVLGAHWEPTGLPFQILCVAGMAQASNYSIYWCYLATGRVRENVKLMLVWKPITIGLLLLGSFWGVTGVAVAFTTGMIGGWLLQLWWSKRLPIAPRKELFSAAARGWLLFLPAAIAASLTVSIVGGWVGISLSILSYLLLLSVVLVASRRIRTDVSDAGRTAMKVVRRTGGRKSR